MDDPLQGANRRARRVNYAAREDSCDVDEPHPGNTPSRPDDVASEGDWSPSISPKKPNEPSGLDSSELTADDIYDSDEDGNSREQYYVLYPDKTSWDPLVVRKCVRSEFIHPGSTWDTPDFHALPPAKATESRLASTTVQSCFSSVFFPRLVQRKVPRRRHEPQRVSNYLAAEIAAQLTMGNSFDRFWDASHDLEEYIRQAIWPQIMQIDAVRLKQGLGSDVVTLAKAVPPPRATGFNNDRFWGYSVYMALRFPPGSHPFTTPVVRNAIAHFRRCLIDGRDPWGSDCTSVDTQMALAASWAGYNIAHHLIDRNVYHLEPAIVQLQRQQIDTLVWLASEAHVLVKDLFKDVLLEKGNIDTADDSLREQMCSTKWERLVGACHRVAYNWDKSLPLPLCKPSRILREMQTICPAEAIENWDGSAPFSTEFDEPLDPSVYKMKGSGLSLSRNVSEKVNRVNRWLLTFLREEPRLDKASTDTFSYLPEGLDYADDHHDEEQPEVRDSEEVRESSADMSPAPPSRELGQEISELRGSIDRIEKVVMDNNDALRDILQHLAQQDMHAMVRLLAPALLEQLEPALAKSTEARMKQAEASVSSMAGNLRADIEEYIDFHLSESGDCVEGLIRPLSDRLDSLEAKNARDNLKRLSGAEARSRRSFSRSTLQRDEDDAPLAHINANRNKLLSNGFAGNSTAKSSELGSASSQPKKRVSEHASSQATKRVRDV